VFFTVVLVSEANCLRIGMVFYVVDSFISFRNCGKRYHGFLVQNLAEWFEIPLSCVINV
jgi:hypothetical protein